MIQLSDKFNYKMLLKFSLPSIAMMLFTSIYGVVDGFFVSNYVGETAFAAINLIMPYCMIFSAIGSLFGVGGSALVAMVKGQGDNERANQIFSMLAYVMIASSLVLEVIAQLFLPTVARLLGASGELFSYCISYARIYLVTLPAFLMQYAFLTFIVTAERPKMGLVFTICAGVSNMIFDWLFIGVLALGVQGAAIATCIGQVIGGFGPLLYFIFSKDLPIHFCKTHFMGKELLKSFSNGFAEFIVNVAMSLVNMVYNIQLMKYLGEYGVSSYGIIMYINFVFVATYLGYSMGVAPVISYHYGAQDGELASLRKKSMVIITAFTLILTVLAELSARLLAGIFAGYDVAFLDMSTQALRLYALCYLFSGFNIFISSMFAALNCGTVSGALSFSRMFVFQLASVLILPLILGPNGIWLSMPLAECLVFLISTVVLTKLKKKFNY